MQRFFSLFVIHRNKFDILQIPTLQSITCRGIELKSDIFADIECQLNEIIVVDKLDLEEINPKVLQKLQSLKTSSVDETSDIGRLAALSPSLAKLSIKYCLNIQDDRLTSAFNGLGIYCIFYVRFLLRMMRFQICGRVFFVEIGHMIIN